MSRVTILYTELADYSLACFKALKSEGVDIQLIHWPINPEAPFTFDLSFIDEVFSRDTLNRDTLRKKVSSFRPDLILCSGWMDKEYVALCRRFKGATTTVLSLDNHWSGSWKQHLARVISPFTLKRSFDRAFVPGKIQKKYAMKLGFSQDDIQTGFYSADTDKFEDYFKNSKSQPTISKRFLYLGRYVEHKGINDLWSAFKKYRKQGGDWELWCVGTGDKFNERVQMEGIKHFGFVQPSELLPILKETDVYILPSHFEPWGVSVHEMATAGFPLLLSEAIGAKEQFLIDGENGALFPSHNVDALAEKLTWISSLSDDEIFSMRSHSHELGKSHNPEIWAKILLSFLQ